MTIAMAGTPSWMSDHGGVPGTNPCMKSQHFILHVFLQGARFHLERARGKLAQAPLHPWGGGAMGLLLTS